MVYTRTMKHISLYDPHLDLNRYRGIIAYEPLRGEVDWKRFPLLTAPKSETVILPTSKEADPFEWALVCKERFEHARSFILIPGTLFDLHGTRYGKGGGWYDRFLSSVPRTWLRIAVANEDQISQTPLSREPWDELMDLLFICSKRTGFIHDCRTLTSDTGKTEDATR